MPQFGGASEKCFVCTKTVYLAEKIVVEDKDEKKTYHKNCLKCTHCKNKLSLGNYASMNGVMYCKPHFKQLFATKGNYDEGFGKDKLTSKWTPAPAPASQTAGSFVPVEKTDDVKSTSEKKDTPSSIASKFGKTTIGVEKCDTCGKTVYATEKIVIEEKDGKKVFHKACLKCSHCSVVLTLGNYAAMNGVTYCKPHFKQLFATKGNYDEGFGKDKHTTNWNPAENSGAPATFVPVEKTDSPRETKATTSSDVASRFKGMGASDKCSACGKTVYLTEKIVVEDKEDKKLFHKGCLRCSHCQVILSLGSYASMGGVFYCKPHFKQLFATKGNYDEGFGKEKHTAKWIDPEDKEAAEERFGGGNSNSESPRKDEAQSENTESIQETPHKEETTHHHEEHTHQEHEHKHEEHEHKHEEHEHKHEEHKHEEHKHEEHEHKHEEHEHKHEHEHHDAHHDHGDDHHEHGDDHHHEHTDDHHHEHADDHDHEEHVHDHDHHHEGEHEHEHEHEHHEDDQ